MKRLKLLAVALVALTFASCSEKTDEPDPAPVPVEKATITLSFTGDAISKVAGEAPDLADKVMNDLTIFAFRENGDLDLDVFPRYITPVNTPTGPSSETLTVSVAVKRIYAIANVGTKEESKTFFAGIDTEAKLKALVKNRITELGSIAKTDVLMTGVSEEITFTTGSLTANAAIVMNFPLAKIMLIVKDKRVGNKTIAELDGSLTEGETAIVDNNVVIYFAGQKVQFFNEAQGGADQAVQTTWHSGEFDYLDPNTSAANNITSITPYYTNDAEASKATWTANKDAVTPTVTHHFYLPANNGGALGTTTPTIIAIQSTRYVKQNGAANAESYAGEGTKKIYYPTKFTMDDAKHTLVAGKSYKVILTLNGKVQQGGASGTESPEDTAIRDGDLNATVTVTGWTGEDVESNFP